MEVIVTVVHDEPTPTTSVEHCVHILDMIVSCEAVQEWSAFMRSGCAISFKDLMRA